MRFVLAILAMLCCVSCSTYEPEHGELSVSKMPDLSDTNRIIALPHLTVTGVQLNDGIQKDEAAILSNEYLRRFVSGCGMPEEPGDRGGFWRVPLYTGYGGTYSGNFWISKDDGAVFFESAKAFLSKSTREIVDHYNTRLQ